MSTIDDKIAQLKAEISAAQLAKVRAEAAIEHEQKMLDDAMRRLKNEFGLDNLGEARAKLEQLQADVENELHEITQILSQIKSDSH